MDHKDSRSSTRMAVTQKEAEKLSIHQDPMRNVDFVIKNLLAGGKYLQIDTWMIWYIIGSLTLNFLNLNWNSPIYDW